MALFWILTAALTALAGLPVLAGARRAAEAGAAAETTAAAAELDDLDRLRERGLLDESSWVAARAEAGRRILSSSRRSTPMKIGRADGRSVLSAVLASGLAALALYALIGAPGTPDQGYEDRVDEWAGELDALTAPQLAAVAARVVAERPDDAEALKMLGAARFEAGDPIAAASAFRRALALEPADAQSWSRLGESLVRANGGRIEGDAEAAFLQAVQHDPGQLGARYFLGEAALARGDASAARGMWLPLIEALDPADPRRADLQARLPAGDGR